MAKRVAKMGPKKLKSYIADHLPLILQLARVPCPI